MKLLVGWTLVLTLFLAGLSRSEPVEAPQEHRSNSGPVLGLAAPPSSPGSLWVVLGEELQGREVLQAEVGRGGSDEVLLNSIDQQGRAWMAVRVPGLPDYGCYVRANTHTIAAAQP